MIKSCSGCLKPGLEEDGIQCQVCGKFFCSMCLETDIEAIYAGELQVVMCKQCNKARMHRIRLRMAEFEMTFTD